MVEYSQSLVQKLEESLRSAFNQPLLRLTRPSGKRGNEIRIRLDTERIAYVQDGPAQLVVEILTDEGRSNTFWFALVAVFSMSELHKYSLQHASLMVFHDIKGELIPLFRAEWDQVDARKSSKHAQPHWHFVQSPRSVESLIRALTGPTAGESTDFVPEQESNLFTGIADCGRIHFAMTSLWEKSDKPPYKKKQFDSDDFPKWFESLTSYVAGQIEYVVSHMPKAATPVARAFVPDSD